MRKQGGARSMTARMWLRVSAVLSLLFAAGHSLGGRKQWSPMGDNPVLRMMKAVQFQTMGVSRSYYDFFMGFGISLSISMLTQAFVLWFMADLATSHAARLRPMILVFLVASLAGVVVAWQYIFPIPALFSLVLCATLGMAALNAR